MMKIRAQIGMALNLDKCIGCHTCSVRCKSVWTSREGVEYAWFNNVETKPGLGFPTEWEKSMSARHQSRTFFRLFDLFSCMTDKFAVLKFRCFF